MEAHMEMSVPVGVERKKWLLPTAIVALVLVMLVKDAGGSADPGDPRLHDPPYRKSHRRPAAATAK